jgi:hypothetical protein
MDWWGWGAYQDDRQRTHQVITYCVLLEGNQLQPGGAQKSSMGYSTCNFQMATLNLLWYLIECWCRDGIPFWHLTTNSSREEFEFLDGLSDLQFANGDFKFAMVSKRMLMPWWYMILAFDNQLLPGGVRIPRWVIRLAIFKLRLWCCCFRLWIRVHAPKKLYIAREFRLPISEWTKYNLPGNLNAFDRNSQERGGVTPSLWRQSGIVPSDR